MNARSRWTRPLYWLALVLALSGQARGDDPATEDRTATGSFPNTPEGAFKEYFYAMGMGDEKVLRSVTLPHDDFEWLLKGKHVAPEKADEYRKIIDEKFLTRRLAPGDIVDLPTGGQLKVRPQEVSEDRVVLLQKGAPLPTRLERHEGRWKVNAGPMIAARKAADAADKRAAADPKGRAKSRKKSADKSREARQK